MEKSIKDLLRPFKTLVSPLVSILYSFSHQGQNEETADLIIIVDMDLMH